MSLVHIPVTDGKKATVSLCQPAQIHALLGRSDTLTITYQIPDSLCAPIRENIPVGTISFYIFHVLGTFFQFIFFIGFEKILYFSKKTCYGIRIVCFARTKVFSLMGTPFFYNMVSEAKGQDCKSTEHSFDIINNLTFSDNNIYISYGGTSRNTDRYCTIY